MATVPDVLRTRHSNAVPEGKSTAPLTAADDISNILVHTMSLNLTSNRIKWAAVLQEGPEAKRARVEGPQENNFSVSNQVRSRRRSDGDLLREVAAVARTRSKSVSSDVLSPLFNLSGAGQEKLRRIARSGSLAARRLEVRRSLSRGSRPKSLDHGRWPPSPGKFPLDTRPPRYPPPSPLPDTELVRSKRREGTAESDADQWEDVDVSAQSTVGHLDGNADQVDQRDQEEPSLQATGSEPVSRSLMRDRKKERPQLKYFADRQLEVDEHSEPLCLWEGATSVDWGKQSSVRERDEQLVRWRKVRATIFYTPTADDVRDRHCSEHEDRNSSEDRKVKQKRKMAVHRHFLRHLWKASCGATGCCMDATGKQLAKRVAKELSRLR